MSSQLPPNPNVSTFNPAYWFNPENALTATEADLLYLKFPVSQSATENFVGPAVFNSSATFIAPVTAVDATFAGDVTFTNISPPHTNALPIAPDDICNKLYVDSKSGLSALQLFFNYTQTFTTPLPITYKLLSSTETLINTPIAWSITSSSVDVLIAGFYNSLVGMNIPTYIPAGIWTMLLYNNVSATGDQLHVGAYFTLSGYNSSGVETILYTSSLSLLFNVVAPAIGSSSVILTIPYVDISMYDGLGIKIYIKSNTNATRTGNIFFQYESGYSSILTSFANSQAPDILDLPNIWTETNTFNKDIVANGFSFGKGLSNVNNMSIGLNAFNSTATGQNNLSIDGNNLSALTTGSYNTAIGRNCLDKTTTGVYNTGIGQSALYANTIGSYNTALGLNNLITNTSGGQNIAIGPNVLIANTTGSNNICMGNRSAQALSSGSGNIGIGFQTLQVATANNVTCLGYASSASSGLTQATAIGANSVVTASNTIQLGTTSDNVNCPNKLSVDGDVEISRTLYSINNSGLLIYNGTMNAPLNIQTNTGVFNVSVNNGTTKSLIVGTNGTTTLDGLITGSGTITTLNNTNITSTGTITGNLFVFSYTGTPAWTNTSQIGYSNIAYGTVANGNSPTATASASAGNAFRNVITNGVSIGVGIWSCECYLIANLYGTGAGAMNYYNVGLSSSSSEASTDKYYTAVMGTYSFPIPSSAYAIVNNTYILTNTATKTWYLYNVSNYIGAGVYTTFLNSGSYIRYTRIG
jgi:hypothetical protein